MENVRKHRNIKLVTTKKRRNYLVAKPNYQTTIFFHKKFVGYKNKKTQVLMNKPVCSALSILELSKTVMYGFWYDYVKPKYSEQAKMSHMDTDINKVVYIRTLYT